MPKGQNAITAQLTVETALRMACAKVSMLGENSWIVVERTGFFEFGVKAHNR